MAYIYSAIIPLFMRTPIKQTYMSYTLAGPTVTGPVQDPLAVTRLNNRPFIFNSYYLKM